MSVLPRLLAAGAIAAICSLPDAGVPTCPMTAPHGWQLGRAPLVDVLVLSHPAGAPPLALPDERSRRGGVLYRTWRLPVAAPARIELVCLYKNTGRRLPVPLSAPGVSRCVLVTARQKLLRLYCS